MGDSITRAGHIEFRVTDLNQARDTQLSHESKIALINKIAEFEEKISQLEDANFPEKLAQIENLSRRVQKIKKDLERFA